MLADLGSSKLMSLESRSSFADNLSGGAPPRQRTPAWYAFAGVMLAATAVIAPFPFLSNTSGHDFAFHIQSWMDISWQWHQGVLFPRWAAWANFGFGEPRFIFYPPISGLLGAALGQILPWRVVPGALIWLMLVTAGLAMFRLAREWLPPRDAIAAAVLYAANPYHLVLAYYRSDFAELVASAVLPWVVLYALRIRRGGARGLVAFALAFAATWLSNAPAAVITTYSVVLLFCVESVAEKSSRALLRGAAAMAAGFGLAAFWWLLSVHWLSSSFSGRSPFNRRTFGETTRERREIRFANANGYMRLALKPPALARPDTERFSL